MRPAPRPLRQLATYLLVGTQAAVCAQAADTVALREATVTAARPIHTGAAARATRALATGQLPAAASAAMALSPGLVAQARGLGAPARISLRGLSGGRLPQVWGGLQVNHPQLGAADWSTLAPYVAGLASPAAEPRVGDPLGPRLTHAEQPSPRNGELAVSLGSAGAMAARGGVGAWRAELSHDPFGGAYYVDAARPRTRVRGDRSGAAVSVQADPGQSWRTQHFFGVARERLATSAAQPDATVALQGLRTLTARHLVAVRARRTELTAAYLADALAFAPGLGRGSSSLVQQVVAAASVPLVEQSGVAASARVELRGVSSRYDGERVRRALITDARLSARGTPWRALTITSVLGVRDRSDVASAPYASAAVVYGERLWRAQIRVEQRARFPTFDDLYWPQGGNPELATERTRELTTDFTFERRPFALRASAWVRSVRDYVLWLPAQPFWRPVGVDHVRGAGGEVLAEAQTARSRVWASVELQRLYAGGRDGETSLLVGRQLPYLPGWSTALGGHRVLAARRLRLGGALRAYGRQYLGYGDASIAPYLNGRVFGSYATVRGLTLTLAADNPLDQALPPLGGVATPRRRLTLSVMYRPPTPATPGS